jgi:hypothetical protein
MRPCLRLVCGILSSLVFLTMPACAQLSEDQVRCLDPRNLQSPKMSQFLASGYFNLRLMYLSRLAADDQPIFGNIVAYDSVWLVDSSDASLEINRNIKIGDLSVPAGKYSLFFMPSLKGLTLIVTKKVGDTGNTYDVSQEIGRVEMIPALPADCKMLTLEISPSLGNVSHGHRDPKCGPNVEGSLDNLVLRFAWREANFYAVVDRDLCVDFNAPKQSGPPSK